MPLVVTKRQFDSEEHQLPSEHITAPDQCRIRYGCNQVQPFPRRLHGIREGAEMKKILITVLFVCVLLLLLPVCHAEKPLTDSFFVTDVNGQCEDYILSTAVFRGDLYMLSNQKLYRYSLTSQEKKTVVDWSVILSALNHGQSRAEWLDDFARTRVNALITAQDAVYGVNERYGTIFRLENDAFVYDTEVDPEQSGIADAFGRIYRTGEHLYYVIHSAGDDADTLCDYDLTRQQLTRYDAGHVAEIARVNERIVLLRESETVQDALEIARLDEQTQSFLTLALFENRNISGICEAEASERLLYLQGNRILELLEQGEAQCVGYIPLEAGSLQYEVLLLSDDAAALVSPSGVYVRAVTAEEPRDHLLRMCLYDTQNIPSFLASNPDIHLMVTDAQQISTEDVIRQLLDGTLAQDVLEVDASSLFQVMADKRYLAELTASSIVANEWEQLYPFVQQAVARDGWILGIPARLQVKTWAYQKELWESVFPDAAPPTNLDELLALFSRWMDDMTTGDAAYCLIYPESICIKALSVDLFQLYIEQFDQADGRLSFHTETFRQTFEAIETLKAACQSRADHVSAEEEIEPLLTSSYHAFLQRDKFSFLEGWVPLLPIALDNQQPPSVSAGMTVYVVNAASEHQQEALRFLEYVAENRTYADERLLKPGVNAPVERAGFAAEYAALQDHIAYLSDQLAVCDESERKELQSTIEAQKALLERNRDNRWLISAEEIQQYRELAQSIRIRQTALTKAASYSGTQTLYDIFRRYVEGNIDLSTCIRMLDERLDMMLME